MDDSEILRQLGKYKFYHIIKLTDTISTPGVEDFAKLHGPVYRAMDRLDFKGKRVLDVGCRDGLFCLEAEKRGALEIEGIDNCLSLGAVEFLIPFLKSRVRMREMGLYNLTPTVLGEFDIVLFLGVLYHLRYPFQALRIVTDILRDGGYMIVETGIFADDDRRSLLFCPVGEESPYERSSCSFFNRKGLIDTLRSFGLRVESVGYCNDEDRSCVDGRVIRGTFLCVNDRSLRKEFPHEYWVGATHENWKK
jgi:SAM-dependent methyltransferase